jgi:regulator of nucleoside diphosphate kinase
MVISKVDYEILTQHISAYELQFKGRQKDRLNTIALLKKKIMSADKVEPEEIPPNIVTMNSVVIVKRLNSNTNFRIKVVYPENVKIRDYKISIFSALGCAVFLHKIGDEMKYSTWKKNNIVKIVSIPFQPEAHGHCY